MINTITIVIELEKFIKYRLNVNRFKIFVDRLKFSIEIALPKIDALSVKHLRDFLPANIEITIRELEWYEGWPNFIKNIFELRRYKND